MGLTLPGSHDENYYTGSSYGQYQFLTLEDIASVQVRPSGSADVQVEIFVGLV